MRRIDAVDVEAGIGLGIAEPLRLRQHVVEIPTALAHGGQDVIAGAVQDPVDAADPIADQPLAQGLDDRDAASHRRLEPDGDAVCLGRMREFRAMMGKQGLVRRHHRLARFECRPAQGERRAVGAADQLDHEIDFRVGRQRQGVVVPAQALQIDAPVAPALARRHRSDADLPPGPFGQQPAVLRQQSQHRRADGAKAGDAQAQRSLHLLRRPPAPGPARCGRRRS